MLLDIGPAVISATACAITAKACRQPLFLAYLFAGIVLGSRVGLELMRDNATIGIISEIGLIAAAVRPRVKN